MIGAYSSQWQVDASRFGCHTSKNYFSTATAKEDGSKIPFLLADIGEGIKEVELLQWYVQPGDTIRQFDKVCEVQSDKATVEITSRFDGVVAELAESVGDMLQVGYPLLYIFAEEGHEGSSPTLDNSKKLQDVDSPPEDDRLKIPSVASQYRLDSDKPSSPSGGKFLASPAVRKLGKEYQLDLSTIQGSGPHNLLLKSDVITYLQEQGRLKPSDLSLQPDVQTNATTVDNDASTSCDLSDTLQKDQIIKLKGYHRMMIQSMTAALSIPHMCFGDEMNVSKLVATRKEFKASGYSVSLLALLLKACSLALQEYPILNSQVHNLENGEMLIKNSHDLGVAVDTPRGLVVPVIRRVQDLTLQSIQEELDRLKVAAQDSKLTQSDLEGPTFTLSNIGTMGGTFMQPVIVPPQVAMGAIGQIQTLPRFDAEGNVKAAQIMTISWAGDHRVLDGATLARFHSTFKSYVENPAFMLMKMK